MKWMCVLLTALIAPDFAPFLIVAAYSGFLIASFVQAVNARRACQAAEIQPEMATKSRAGVT